MRATVSNRAHQSKRWEKNCSHGTRIEPAGNDDNNYYNQSPHVRVGVGNMMRWKV